jgi:hypothetical protein
MIYVYCPRASQGAFELVTALGAKRLRKFDGIDFWRKRERCKLKPEDIIICWGNSIPEQDGVRVLNGLDKPVNKLDELDLLAMNGVPTISVYKDVAKAHPSLIPRVLHHEGGMDLLVRPKRFDYQVLRELFLKEFRIHSFNGRSIRAGQKVPREGFTEVKDEKLFTLNSNLVHPWIRSFEGGWRVNYDGFQSTSQMRKLAHLAVKALGLTFGAVDIGLAQNGGMKVFEVNRAPGIEGNTVQSYVRAITRWMQKEPIEDEVEAEQPKGEPVGIPIEPPEVVEEAVRNDVRRAGGRAGRARPFADIGEALRREQERLQRQQDQQLRLQAQPPWANVPIQPPDPLQQQQVAQQIQDRIFRADEAMWRILNDAGNHP